MIKNTDDQPGEEKHGARSQTVPGTGGSVPMELGYITLLVWMHSPA